MAREKTRFVFPLFPAMDRLDDTTMDWGEGIISPQADLSAAGEIAKGRQGGILGRLADTVLMVRSLEKGCSFGYFSCAKKSSPPEAREAFRIANCGWRIGKTQSGKAFRISDFGLRIGKTHHGKNVRGEDVRGEDVRRSRFFDGLRKMAVS